MTCMPRSAFPFAGRAPSHRGSGERGEHPQIGNDDIAVNEDYDHPNGGAAGNEKPDEVGKPGNRVAERVEQLSHVGSLFAGAGGRSVGNIGRFDDQSDHQCCFDGEAPIREIHDQKERAENEPRERDLVSETETWNQ